jgi:Trypsin-like peptidase domain
VRFWLMVFALLAAPVRSATFPWLEDTPPGARFIPGLHFDFDSVTDDALQYGSWHGGVTRSGGSITWCSMSASFGLTISAKLFVYAESMDGEFDLLTPDIFSGSGDFHSKDITATLGFLGTEDFPVEAHESRGLMSIRFKQNDRIVAGLLSGAKVLRVSVPGGPYFDIAEFGAAGAAYEYLRDCAMSGSPPPTYILGPDDRYAHFAGVDSPLVLVMNYVHGKPLQPDAIALLSAMSTYVIHAANKDSELGSLGSGVAVGRHTLLTNCHVVMSQSLNRDQAGVEPEGANKFPFDRVYDTMTIEAQDGDGSRWPAQVTSHHCEFDLALLTTIADLYPVRGIRPFDGLSKGEPVYALGAPRGLSGTFTSGIIANLKPHEKYGPMMPDVDLVLTTAAITHGNSGGGLFDQYGDLIGLNQAVLPDLPGIFVVIPIVELMRPNIGAPSAKQN